MSESQLLTIIAVSSGIVAISMGVIAWCAVSARESIRNLEERANQFLDTWEPVAEETSSAVKDFTEQSGELLSRLNSLSATLQKQALHADSLIKDLATTAHANLREVDTAVRSTVARFNAVSEALERAVKLPAAKVRALMEGISVALRHLAQGRRPSPERISTDEEMFI